MSFVLQLDLRTPLRQSENFAFAFVFVCNNENIAPGGAPCEPYFADAGANALLLSTTAGNVKVDTPRGVETWPERAIDFVPFKRDDEPASGAGLNPTFLQMLQQAEQKATGDAEIEIRLPDHWMSPKTIQLGGDPVWLQNPARPKCPKCRGRMKLLAQIDAEVAESSFDNEAYSLPFGWGYMFICQRECDRSGTAFLWQIT